MRFEFNRDRKFFCIGLNKTGTTSLESAFKDLGFLVDDQNKAHRLMYNYEKREFSEIVKYCKVSEVFQDAPFSMKYTYMFLEQAYPKAKFILSIRDSAEQWYESLIRFHSKLFGLNGRIPTKEDLENAQRPHGRNPYMNLKMRFGTPDDDIYHRETLINYYDSHNTDVVNYFRVLKEKLLVINLKETTSYQRFCSFVGAKPIGDSFPWVNKS